MSDVNVKIAKESAVMYKAEGDKIYVELEGVGRQLFVTIHPTDTGATMTVEQQAETLARILNER